MFFATKWSFKVDDSARTIRSVKENRHARMLWTEHVNIRHLGSSKCSVVYCEVKCPFWLRRHFSSKLGKSFHLTLLYNAFFQLSFFLIAPNFLALATTLENLGARWLLAKKVNFVPCICMYIKSLLSKLKSAFALRIDFLNLGQFYFSIFA